MRATTLWTPALILGVGAVLTVGVDTQRTMPLRAPLDSVIPRKIAGLVAEDVVLSDAEARVAGMDEYLMRNYTSPTLGDSTWFSLYIGYYERQLRGRTIHTPKNCLPGAGWEVLASEPVTIQGAEGTVTVNKYVLQRKGQQALVLYWYQGRGRVEANEYVVKWDLLRDSALRQRSDEALVRVVVPMLDEATALELASDVATSIIPSLDQGLPR